MSPKKKNTGIPVINNANGTLPIDDKRTKKRIDEHLSDEEDKITEEDISRADTGNIQEAINEIEQLNRGNPPGETTATQDEEQAGKKIKDDLDPEIDNSSWNILEGNN